MTGYPSEWQVANLPESWNTNLALSIEPLKASALLSIDPSTSLQLASTPSVPTSSLSPSSGRPSEAYPETTIASHQFDLVEQLVRPDDGTRGLHFYRQEHTGSPEQLELCCPFRVRNPKRFSVREYAVCSTQTFPNMSILK